MIKYTLGTHIIELTPVEGEDIDVTALKEAVKQSLDLSGIQICELEFIGHDFTGCDLSGAHFNNCNFTSCNFTRCNLSGAVFTACDMRHCDFRLAKIKNAQFFASTFTGSDLRYVDYGDLKIPIIPDIHKKVYNAAKRPGALNMSRMQNNTLPCRVGCAPCWI